MYRFVSIANRRSKASLYRISSQCHNHGPLAVLSTKAITNIPQSSLYSTAKDGGEVSQNEYLRVVNDTLHHLVDVLSPHVEAWVEEHEEMDDEDIEVDDAGDGVVNIRLGNKGGTFVISRQTPSQQLWLSSPVSGPWHYRYEMQTGEWVCTKGNSPFWELMESEMSDILQREIKLKESFGKDE